MMFISWIFKNKKLNTRWLSNLESRVLFDTKFKFIPNPSIKF